MSTFPQRLRELRKVNNILQKEMAELLKISVRQYSTYESETSNIDIPLSKVVFLADYFKVSLDYLTGRTDDPKLSTDTTNFTQPRPLFTEHEQLLITKYRKQPDMQKAIDKLLDIKPAVAALKVARSKSGTTNTATSNPITTVTGDFSDLLNATPVIDDDDL